MERKNTYRKWPIICLFLIFGIKSVHAQFPKNLPKFPVVSGAGAIKAMAQKGNLLYVAGDFTALEKKPLVFAVGFDKIGDASPNLSFVVPDLDNGPYHTNLTTTLADGNGGFYIFGDYNIFNKVGGEDRNNMAHINADGSLNAWDPKAGFSYGNDINFATLIGGNVIVHGNFGQIAGQTYAQTIAALDGTTGATLPGWENLGLSPDFDFQRESPIWSGNNTLYALGFNYSTNHDEIAVIDVSDISHPAVQGYFNVDGGDVNGPRLLIEQKFAAENILYVSAVGSDPDGNNTYQNTTGSGQAFNSKLYAVNANTGKFIRDFNTGIGDFDAFNILGTDNDNIYIAYTTSGGTETKIKAFNKNTGNTVDLPWPTLTGFPNSAIITSDKHLIIGSGITKVNGIDRSFAAIDLTTGALLDWNPKVTGITSLAESNGKIYLSGNKFNYSYPGLVYKGLAAININTGEAQPWVPADFKGVFNAMSISGNTMYIGGKFTSSDGNGTIENLAAYDVSDPANPVLKTDWTPNPAGEVDALVLSGNMLYAGGDFSHITGQARKRLGAFDISSGTGTLTTWNPGADNKVNVLAVLDNKLYAGGAFLNIGTTPRAAVAAFDLNANGVLTAWDPKLSIVGVSLIAVNALAAQPADGVNHNARIFLGGTYFNRAGVDRSTISTGFTAVNTTDGALDAWQFPVGFGRGEDAIVRSLYISNNKIYAGGDNFANSADVSNNFAQLDATAYLGADVFGAVRSIQSAGNLVFFGGDFESRTVLHANGFAAFQTGEIVPELTFADITANYGDAVFTPLATSTVTTEPITYSIADGDNTENVISLTDGKITILKPGIATITASQTGAANVKAKITVNKAILTINPKDTIIVVGQPIDNLPFTLSGYKFDDAVKAGIVTGAPVFTTTATSSSPAGTYPVSIGSAGTLASAYYSFTAGEVNATITITATGSKPQIITFPTIVAKNYGDADFDLNGTTDASGLTVSYTTSDPAIATITNGKLHITGAGTVTITASQAGNITYAPAANVTQTFTIAKVPLSITADNQVKNRGDANPVLTAAFSGFVNGDNAADLAVQPVITTTATINSAPGVYPITVAGAASPNYTITYVNSVITVRGTQIITFTPLSTLTYGDAPFDPGATSDAGASFKPVYTTNNPSIVAISNGQAVIKGAGTATITATFAAANGFDLTTATEQITVLKKQLVITADNKARNYGESNPVFTFTYNGFVTGDNAGNGVLTAQPSAATTAINNSPLGVYPITVNGAAANNYNIVYVSGNLTVNAATRVLTFAALTAKTYGDADFDPGATSSTSETPVYSVSDPNIATIVNGKIHLTGAGSTTVTATLPANAGYNGATTATQNLTVAKAKLTITADNKTKTQGPPDILLTASYTGFVLGDNLTKLSIQPVLTTTANSNSPIGTYQITASGASSPNYDITYQTGILTIIPEADGTDNSLEAWASSRSALEVRVYVAESQKAAIQLYSFSGQRLITVEKQLAAGLNQQQLNVASLPAGVYVLHVTGAKLNLKQNIIVK